MGQRLKLLDKIIELASNKIGDIMNQKSDCKKCTSDVAIDTFPELRTIPPGWGDLSSEINENNSVDNDSRIISELDNNATEAFL